MFIPGAQSSCTDIILGSGILLLPEARNFNHRVHCVSLWHFEPSGLLDEHLYISKVSGSSSWQTACLRESCSLLSSSFQLDYDKKHLDEHEGTYGASAMFSLFCVTY